MPIVNKPISTSGSVSASVNSNMAARINAHTAIGASGLSNIFSMLRIYSSSIGTRTNPLSRSDRPAGRRQHVDDSVAVAGRVGLDDRLGLPAEVPPVNDGLDRYREGRGGLFRNSHGHPAVNTRGDFKRAAHKGIIFRQLPRFQQFPDSAGVLAECLSVGPQVVSCELGCGATITTL